MPAPYLSLIHNLCNGYSVFDFDTAKLSVHTLDIGLAGIEVYDILRDEYDIQIEFGDIGNILAYLSIGDRPQEIERLVSALAEKMCIRDSLVTVPLPAGPKGQFKVRYSFSLYKAHNQLTQLQLSLIHI